MKNAYLIVTFDVSEQHQPAFQGWLRAFFLQPPQGMGLRANPHCFRGLQVETRMRTYLPSPSYVVLFPFEADPSEVLQSEAFLKWWTKGIKDRFGWIIKQNWILAELAHGPATPIDCTRALITQVDLPEAHRNNWGAWYDEVHIPQSRSVPDFFRAENRRFTAREIATKDWSCAPTPSSVHFVPIIDGADVVSSAATDEYLDLMVDTQARWAGVIRTASSTICESFV